MAQKMSAEEMSANQKQISISEFFEKNRHLLGYDNKIKAMLIIVKEAVDNALDATEEAGILPDIYLKVEEIGKEKFRILIKDNGPGIVKKQIPKIFGSLLYGSKFHRLRQSRGQQGLGISCAVLYSQLTTGEPTEVISSTGSGKLHKFKIKIDVKKNAPVIVEEAESKSTSQWRGVQTAFICEGVYREHKQSILEYIKQTAVSHPYANITFDAPSGRLTFKRVVDKLPREPKEIKPHLYGVEVGVMSRMIASTNARSVLGFLTTEFSRVGKTSAEEICKKADVDSKISPRRLEDKDIVNIVAAVKDVKLSRPPTDVLSPLTEELIEKGMMKELNPDFIAVITRSPDVYRGWPFQIEAGIAYGGGISGNDAGKVMRFANRVPLLYQQGDCAMTKAAQTMDWKRYNIDSDKLPTGPVVLFVHMCSVWVPFTSESKEAIANYPIIIKEIKLALQECARKLSLYLSGIRKAERQAERRKIFERYMEETTIALHELTGVDKDKVLADLQTLVKNSIQTMLDEENGGEKENKEKEEKPKEQPKKQNEVKK